MTIASEGCPTPSPRGMSEDSQSYPPGSCWKPDFRNCFDEESCRFFLRDVGARVVPYYPFSFGMEEVYSLILEQYGSNGFPDATSVLQDLLEGDTSANGLGDDGDIWRSWRHSWRHRNDDPRNPFIPKIGSIVLDQPTTSEVRRCKADNFIARCSNNLCEGTMSKPLQEVAWVNLQSDPQQEPTKARSDTVFGMHERLKNRSHFVSHQRCRLLSPTNRGVLTDKGRTERQGGKGPSSQRPIPSDRKSQQDSAGITRSSNFESVESPLLLILPDDSLLVKQRHSSSGSPACDIQTLTRDCSARSVDSGYEFVISQAGKDANSSRKGSQKMFVEALPAIPSTHDVRKESIHQERSGGTKSKPADGEHSPGEATAVLRLTGCNEDGTRPREEKKNLSARDISDGVDKPRGVNRQARLIDGALFTSCLPHEPESPQQPNQQHDFETEAERKPSSRLVRAQSDPKRSHRHSWFEDFRSWCRKSSNIDRRLSKKMVERETSVDLNIHPTASHKTQHIIYKTKPRSSLQCRHETENLHTMGLDGAMDGFTSQTRKNANINKPLPLNPGEIVQSLSARHTVSSLTDQQYRAALTGSIASTLSSSGTPSTSATSDSATFHFHTAEIPGHHDLAPVHKDKTLDRANMHPPKSPILPNPRASFTSMMGHNPFIEDSASLISPILPPPPLSVRLHQENKPALPRSNTEPQMTHLGSVSQSSNDSSPKLKRSKSKGSSGSSSPIKMQASLQAPFDDQYRRPLSTDKQQSQPAPIDKHFPPSSFKNSQTVSERSGPPLPELETTKTDQNRPRSPIRKLFAFGKSTSTQNLPATPDPSPKKESPSSRAKSSLKNFSHKLRHGFLVADLEQLEYEANLEQHLDTTSPAFKHPKLAISLKPIYQARLMSEVEVMVVMTANNFLLRQTKNGSLPTEIVSLFRKSWARKNNPEVVEFLFDQTTQRDIIMNSLSKLKFADEYERNPAAVSTTLQGWAVMCREMNLRVFCRPDSEIRRHLSDAHRLLDMLGVQPHIRIAFEELQLRTLRYLSRKQRKHVGSGSESHRRSASDPNCEYYGIQRRDMSNFSDRTVSSREIWADYDPCGPDLLTPPLPPSISSKTRLSPSPAPPSGILKNGKTRKATGASGAVMGSPSRSPYQGSKSRITRAGDQTRKWQDNTPLASAKGGRLGLTIHDERDDLLAHTRSSSH